VEVSAGIYTETIRNTLPSGMSWASPFTLRAKTGDIVTIKASSESNIFLAGIGTPSMYSIIDGFVLDGSNVSNNNITIAGPQFIRLKNLDIKNTANWSGIYTGMTQYLEVINCKIHDGAYLPTGFGHGIYVEGSNNLIEGNEFYNLPAYGVHIYSSTNAPSNNTIRGNSVHEFGLQRATAAGILVTSNGSGNQVYSNKVFNGKGLYNDGGIGIAVDRTSNSYVNGNTVYNNTWYGISAQSTTNAIVTNNTLSQNGVNLITSGSNGGTFSGN
jgi:parallel beta-helix repeat protein